MDGTVMAIEEPNYAVIKQDGDFEIREYSPFIIAQVIVTKNEVVQTQSEASRVGFKLIADYIFGNNYLANSDKQASTKIAMTAPVTSQKIAMTAPVSTSENNDSEQTSWKIHFVMPQTYNMQTLPVPNNSQVILKEVGKHRVATIRFSGFTNDEKVSNKTQALQQWMQANQLKAINTPSLARYNPPWTLPFLRRNEILIEIESRIDNLNP